MKNKKPCIQAAVLVSGNGSNLQALIDYEKSSFCPYRIQVVFSDKKCAFALERSKKAGIACFVVSPYAVMGADKAVFAGKDEKRSAVSERVLQLCRFYKIDMIILAGFLTVLKGRLLEEYEGRIINLHPALLPKFGGEGMWGSFVHEAVLHSGEKESGCTVHLVTAGCDTGPVLLQKKVPVLPDDTAALLAARIAEKEHKAIVEGACLLASALAEKG